MDGFTNRKHNHSIEQEDETEDSYESALFGEFTWETPLSFMGTHLLYPFLWGFAGAIGVSVGKSHAFLPFFFIYSST